MKMAVMKMVVLLRMMMNAKNYFKKMIEHEHQRGWLTSSVRNKIEAHLKEAAFVQYILPVTKIVVETASFDIQKIKNPGISGSAYQGSAAGLLERAGVRPVLRRACMPVLQREIEG